MGMAVCDRAVVAVGLALHTVEVAPTQRNIDVLIGACDTLVVAVGDLIEEKVFSKESDSNLIRRDARLAYTSATVLRTTLRRHGVKSPHMAVDVQNVMLRLWVLCTRV